MYFLICKLRNFKLRHLAHATSSDARISSSFLLLLVWHLLLVAMQTSLFEHQTGKHA